MKFSIHFLLIAFSITLSAQSYSVIPKPYFSQVKGSKFSISGTNITGYCPNKYFTTDYVKRFFGSNDTSSKYTRIDINVDSGQGSYEAYNIKIQSPNDIIINGGTSGVYFALQTLKQLEENGTLAVGDIVDYPQFKYRGMHLDVCRHFFTVEEVKKYIDMLARYKFNTFHWHLTEDQGWRIEIKKYPNLTTIGSKRKNTLIGKQTNPEGKGEYDNQAVEGYYTQEQVKEVVAYAKERFITVIPEIELPGHSLAAIASYPLLGCTGKSVEVGNRWGVYDDVYCAGKDSTFKFLEDVLDEVMALFPSKYIHIGGDEVVKNNWKKCPHCQSRMKKEYLVNEDQLQSYFIRRIESYLNARGRNIIGWDEILEGGLAPNATVMSWRGEKGGIEAAHAKHKVIMTPGKPCYFDHGHTKSKEEPLNIGGRNSVSDVYHYNPSPFKAKDTLFQYILGAQGNVWTEYIPSFKQVEYMTNPRMQALSETLWLDQQLKNYPNFLERLGVELTLLDKKGINYRLPEPIGYMDTMRIHLERDLKLSPVCKSHKLDVKLDDKDISNRIDNYLIEPSDKDRKISITVDNGKRKSNPYYIIIPKIK